MAEQAEKVTNLHGSIISELPKDYQDVVEGEGVGQVVDNVKSSIITGILYYNPER